jgi:cyclic pyranopterin phosphate synthase
MKTLTHIDRQGRAKMVDVSKKPSARRTAVAGGSVTMNPATLKLIKENQIPKGDVLCVARIAGISAAKKTSDLIPMCHPLNIESVTVCFAIDDKKSRIDIQAEVKVTGRTGVEMEALTAVCAAALAVYDMCKAVDKEMVISDVLLLEKKGGRSGTYRRKR